MFGIDPQRGEKAPMTSSRRRFALLARWLPLVVAVTLPGCASAPSGQGAAEAGPAVAPAPAAGAVYEGPFGPDDKAATNGVLTGTDLAERWGVEVTSVRLSASDHMIDFRYRVLDADKAAPLFTRQTKPNLIHLASGKVLAVPQPAKVGALRSTRPPQAGKIYWMFFGNPGMVKAGDKVTVVIGDFRAENLVVQ